MAIKLYNKSRCPDEILRPIITAAAKRVPGVRTGIVVKVLGPVRWGYTGRAHHGQPYLWHLTRKKITGPKRRRPIPSDGGWIEVHIPRQHLAGNHLQRAEEFFDLCVHEWSHIRDFQAACRGNRLPESYCENHDNRPQEVRANAAVRRAKERYYSPTAEAAILALAMWLEQ